jgi:hypothetical protein
MAASAWTFFDEFRIDLGQGVYNLDTDNIDIHLFTTAASANINNDGLSTLGSIGSEVASAAGYSQSGKLLTATYSVGDNSGQARFDFSDVVFTANGGTISNIRYALLVRRGASGKDGAGLVIARAALTTTQSPLGSGSTLTVGTPTGDGVFELTGG